METIHIPILRKIRNNNTSIAFSLSSAIHSKVLRGTEVRVQIKSQQVVRKGRGTRFIRGNVCGAGHQASD